MTPKKKKTENEYPSQQFSFKAEKNNVRKQLPACQPRRKGRPVLPRKHSAPVVETAGCGVGRANLSHWKPHKHGKQAGDEPPIGGAHRSTICKPRVEKGGYTSENRYNWEGEGEIRYHPAIPNKTPLLVPQITCKIITTQTQKTIKTSKKKKKKKGWSHHLR